MWASLKIKEGSTYSKNKFFKKKLTSNPHDPLLLNLMVKIKFKKKIHQPLDLKEWMSMI